MTSKNKDTDMLLKLLELDGAIKDKVDKRHIEKIIQNSCIIGSLGENGITALHIAQHERLIEVSKLLISYGIDFTLKNSMGSTALHAAMERAYEHETYIAFPLLKATCDFADLILSAHTQLKDFNNSCNKNGISYFHAACTVNNAEAVRFFLDNGVSVDRPIDADSPFLSGYTALHIAVEYCNLKIVPVLLQYNANVYAKNSEGLNPVQMCVKQTIEKYDYMLSHSESINELIKKKLEMSDQILYLMLKKYSFIDDNGLSYLHISCVMANSRLANHFLEQHINIDHSTEMDSPIFAGYTALHFAAKCNIDTVKLLIAKGANIHLKDSETQSPFDLCLQRFSVGKMHSILLCHPVWKDILLVDNKTKLMDLIYALRDLNHFERFLQNICLNMEKALIPSNSPLWPGYTLLHLVVTLSNKRDPFFYSCLIEKSLEKGAIATTQDSFGSTPLHLAVQKGTYVYRKIFTHLWGSCKEIVNPIDKNNLSHLHILCSCTYSPADFPPLTIEDADLLKQLLLKDKKMKVQSHIAYTGHTLEGIISGSTPLHLAINYIEEAKLLLEYGADVYAEDSQGLTPIHRLFGKYKYGTEQSSKILSMIPDLKDCIVNNIGLSHLHVASHSDNVECLKKLLDRGADINTRISLELPEEFSFMKEYAGFTPLQIAVSDNCKKVIDFLLRHGADMFTKRNADDLSLIYKVFNSTNDNHLTAFADTLKNNYALQRRFNEETGLTMFHVACYQFDVNMMKHYLLNAGAEINAQARQDSPIWPGFTALHILRDRVQLLGWDDDFRRFSDEDKLKNDGIVDGVLNFLLNHGADVTIADTNGNTPLHLFCQKMVASNKKTYVRVCSLLKTQKDFRLNPTNSKGISHFHIACMVNDFATVQRFFKHGIDVDKPNNQGDTALHLSAGSSVVEFSRSAAQLKTIDHLLKRDAKLDVKNNVGNSPLHEAAIGRSTVDVKIFERLTKAGADPNAENIKGVTPLEYLCTSRNSSAKHFELFIKRGCQLNVFNPTSDEGFIGLILNSQNSERESIWKLVLSLPEVKETDETGRSVIHNVVSLLKRTVKIDFYPRIIEELVNIGCHIDAQDKTGETALHRAVKFENVAAVSALIEAGADINAVDKNGKTALARALHHPFKSCDYDDDSSDSFQMQINEILLRQVFISLYFGLHVCQINKDMQTKSKAIFGWWHINKDRNLLNELNKVKNVKIGETLTLRRFLSEKTIVSYPYTSLSNRSAVCTFVKSIDNSELQTLKPLIKLVFRKAEMRIDLVKGANDSLRILLDSPIPEVCSRIIFEYLRNADLENLITAAFEEV